MSEVRIPKKRCPGCLEVKELTDFSPVRKDDPELIPSKRQGICRPCNSLKRREYPFRVYKKINNQYVFTGQYR